MAKYLAQFPAWIAAVHIGCFQMLIVGKGIVQIGRVSRASPFFHQIAVAAQMIDVGMGVKDKLQFPPLFLQNFIDGLCRLVSISRINQTNVLFI